VHWSLFGRPSSCYSSRRVRVYCMAHRRHERPCGPHAATVGVDRTQPACSYAPVCALWPMPHAALRPSTNAHRIPQSRSLPQHERRCAFAVRAARIFLIKRGERSNGRVCLAHVTRGHCALWRSCSHTSCRHHADAPVRRSGRAFTVELSESVHSGGRGCTKYGFNAIMVYVCAW
jgi:hypothetical protein